MYDPKEEVNFTQNKDSLVVNQSEKAAHAIYDLCDFDGRIKQTGYLDEAGKAQIDISKINQGRYQLFIINEGSIFKSVVDIK